MTTSGSGLSTTASFEQEFMKSMPKNRAVANAEYFIGCELEMVYE